MNLNFKQRVHSILEFGAGTAVPDIYRHEIPKGDPLLETMRSSYDRSAKRPWRLCSTGQRMWILLVLSVLLFCALIALALVLAFAKWAPIFSITVFAFVAILYFLAKRL